MGVEILEDPCGFIIYYMVACNFREWTQIAFNRNIDLEENCNGGLHSSKTAVTVSFFIF